MKPHKSKRTSAWLIAWEGSEHHLSHIPKPHVLAFIDSRKSRSALREMVFGIYLASSELTVEERFNLALSNEGKKRLRREDALSVSCGFNPKVTARQVDDLEIETGDKEVVIRWKKPVAEVSPIDGMLRVTRSVDLEERISRPIV